MSRKFIFPILVLVLAILACNIQTAPPTSTPVVIPDTTASPEPTSTPVTPSVIPDTPVGPTAVPGSLTPDMLRNGTYHTPFYDRIVTLVNGSYSEGSGSNIFSVQMLDIYAFGDLDGDGKDDAAILLAENGGGSGTFVSLIAILDQGGTPHQAS
jgi:hypothetical protein